MRHLVVGTAGHIDHGKSALVEALTGVHPDRLEEEQRRGITIELGFADLDLAPDGVVAFVDVPGHERFVRHMVSGASGLDAVLLVVAADEGVMPQTREHLAICSLLGLRHGIVVLSKADLADDDLRRVVRLEVEEAVAGTFLQGATVVATSARTKEGLESLRDALRRLAREIPEREPSGVPRLPIDRSFVMKGFGTVVTGTLASGTLVEGDEVQILPGGRTARIRGLQVHRHKVREARAGRRVAVNLQGIECAEAPRGATLARPGTLRPTRRARVVVELLPGAPRLSGRGGPVRFHQGTCERAARLRLEAAAQGGGEAEIVLAQDTVLLPGDRFILRRPAPVDTIGGGVVIDAHPAPRRRGAPIAAAADAADVWIERIDRAGVAGRAVADVCAEAGRSAAEVDAALAPLIASGRVVRSGSRLFAGSRWEETGEALLDALRSFHASEPLRRGLDRETLRGRVAPAMPAEAFRDLLRRLSGEGALTLDRELVSIAGHRIEPTEADAARARRIEEAFRAAGLDPPPVETVVREAGGDPEMRVVGWLVEEGRLVKLRDGRLFHAPAIQALRGKVREFARTSSTIDVAAFKELAGVTRKNAIPLLELFDEERLTRREGSVRRILTD
ncbi:MAG TPA: selenocysteine-specific translation elongation factor [Candidatus Polarisedimenticolaceae bacterium]|nr:selenocysteine-specific translation elongation factor [Candidatus Polarisedimenticolaceae bacterium]